MYGIIIVIPISIIITIILIIVTTITNHTTPPLSLSLTEDQFGCCGLLNVRACVSASEIWNVHLCMHVFKCICMYVCLWNNHMYSHHVISILLHYIWISMDGCVRGTIELTVWWVQQLLLLLVVLCSFDFS